ncbi:MAG: hypothetical protein L6R40_000650 [Gallowayella cf. fulva]|nr:MAG: hypothetical protein L6R40_000650 [Xanthomendoza cf. fulva]
MLQLAAVLAPGPLDPTQTGRQQPFTTALHPDAPSHRGPTLAPDRQVKRGMRNHMIPNAMAPGTVGVNPEVIPGASRAGVVILGIVVEKLTKNVNEHHLREIFGSYGPIKDLDLPMNKQFMTNRGTAYILYANTTDAEAAIAHMHEAQLDGAIISVSVVLPRRKFSRSPPPARRGGPPFDRFEGRDAPPLLEDMDVDLGPGIATLIRIDPARIRGQDLGHTRHGPAALRPHGVVADTERGERRRHRPGGAEDEGEVQVIRAIRAIVIVVAAGIGEGAGTGEIDEGRSRKFRRWCSVLTLIPHANHRDIRGPLIDVKTRSWEPRRPGRTLDGELVLHRQCFPRHWRNKLLASVTSRKILYLFWEHGG